MTTYTCSPERLTYSYETGRATLETRISTSSQNLWADGAVAFALLQQVTKQVTSLTVTLDDQDATRIIAFSILYE
jgi:hypothetical protein